MSKRCVGVNREGVVYVQSLLVITIMVLMTVALLQWTLIMVAHQAVNNATCEGARVAARTQFSGQSQQAVTEMAVHNVLTAHGMEATDAAIIIVNGANTVSVEVHIPFGSAAVPDWLGAFGLSMSNCEFHSMAIGWK